MFNNMPQITHIRLKTKYTSEYKLPKYKSPSSVCSKRIWFIVTFLSLIKNHWVQNVFLSATAIAYFKVLFLFRLEAPPFITPSETLYEDAYAQDL